MGNKDTNLRNTSLAKAIGIQESKQNISEGGMVRIMGDSSMFHDAHASRNSEGKKREKLIKSVIGKTTGGDHAAKVEKIMRDHSLTDLEKKNAKYWLDAGNKAYKSKNESAFGNRVEAAGDITKGSTVIALTGPHKGDKHEVIHDFGNGYVNVMPMTNKVRYPHGAAKAKVSDLKLVEAVGNLEELTSAEKKQINQMYDKKGNLTPIGKMVMKKGSAASKLTPKDLEDDKNTRKQYIATQKANRNEEKDDDLKEDRRTELHHQSMMFTHAMKQAEFKKKDPSLANRHDVAGKLHAKAADMYVDNHPDAKKDSDKANKASKLLGEDLEEEKGGRPLSKKEIRQGLASIKAQPKGNVTLKKAPWNEETEDKSDESEKTGPMDKYMKAISKSVSESKSGSGYDLYHKDFSGAMKHAYDHASKRLGVEIDPQEIDDKVASGPKKPSSGKTNSYTLKSKDGKSSVQIQVANLDNKRYELNMYKS